MLEALASMVPWKNCDSKAVFSTPVTKRVPPPLLPAKKAISTTVRKPIYTSSPPNDRIRKPHSCLILATRSDELIFSDRRSRAFRPEKIKISHVTWKIPFKNW
jgi:hypothetical protein